MARRLELKGRIADGTDPNTVGLRIMNGTTTGNRVEETPGSKSSDPPAATQETIRKYKGINFGFKFKRPNLNFSLCTYHPLLIFFGG
ncbi:MAG: hypothetical protein ACM3SR_07855 [Ignavibacteriales bacterium]